VLVFVLILFNRFDLDLLFFVFDLVYDIDLGFNYGNDDPLLINRVLLLFLLIFDIILIFDVLVLLNKD